MTTCGVALHRPIELRLQHAGQSFCSMYDAFDTTDTVLFARIRKSEDYTSYLGNFLHTTTTSLKTRLPYMPLLSRFPGLASNTHAGQGHFSVLYECMGLLAVLGVVVEVQTETYAVTPCTF